MGYESRIYIVKKTGIPGYGHPEKKWAEVLMTFNLGRVSVNMERWLRKQKPTDVYIYADDGNTEIIEDMVGDPLREIDLIYLRNVLLEEIDRGPKTYSEQLFILAHCVLEHLMIYHDFRSEDIVCLHYGY